MRKKVQNIPSPQTPEDFEEMMIHLATECAKKKLMDGTASSQLITHYLKLGSSRNKLEAELLMAKKDSLNKQQTSEEMYKNAVEAMREYSGNGEDEHE